MQGRSPRPVAKPSSPDFSIRVPTVKSGSVASSTVEVEGPTVVTRPTSPSPLMTVLSRWMPSSLPTSRVTVQEKPWEAPMPMTSAPLMPYWPVPATRRSLSSSTERARLRSSLPSRCLSLVFSCSSWLIRLCRASESRMAATALPTGSTAFATPSSTGPKAEAAA